MYFTDLAFIHLFKRKVKIPGTECLNNYLDVMTPTKNKYHKMKGNDGDHGKCYLTANRY